MAQAAVSEEPSPLAKLNPREEQALSAYYDNLLKISEEVDSERRPSRGAMGDAPRMAKPAENNLETVVARDDMGRRYHKRVEYLFRRIEEMPAAEMRVELQKINKSQHGSAKELRSRLRQHYRSEFALVQLKKEDNGNRVKNLRKRFRYLIAMDIEATCEEKVNNINYQHETIELPAVLVDCDTLDIIDKFRTYVRPEINPILTEFCSNFCHIPQKTMDEAPLFPEAWMRLLEWMERYGMMGGDENATFAIVTDGPNDIWHFLQRSFLQYNMKIPHEFRHFINIKKIFENRVNKLGKGDGKGTSIVKMCDRLGIELDGESHQGLTDSIHVAKIAIELVRTKATLEINQRIVRNLNQPLCLPPPADEEEIARLSEQSMYRRGEPPNSATDGARRLPYELKPVTRDEFNTDAYWDCESCDEREP